MSLADQSYEEVADQPRSWPCQLRQLINQYTADNDKGFMTKTNREAILRLHGQPEMTYNIPPCLQLNKEGGRGGALNFPPTLTQARVGCQHCQVSSLPMLLGHFSLMAITSCL